MKRCSKCRIEKENSEFSKDKHSKCGLTGQCKECRAANQKRWVLSNPGAIKIINDKHREKRKEFYSSPEGVICSRRAHLKRVYGITLEQYDEMLRSHNGKCHLCGGLETHDKHNVLAVDHCHKTGKIRGLLCYKCNTGLGVFNDSPNLLSDAINYLNKHNIEH